MKLNKIILPIVACALTFGSCYDEKMEWGTPDGHGDVTISEIPLALAEQLANYDFIKKYAAQYAPNMTIGLGLTADLYINEPQYKQVADDNFQLFTTGNAMKHAAVVQNNGELNFTTIDAFLNMVPNDIKIYGHNFLWHTQQKQNYLKSLIAPEVKVDVSDDDVCENIVGNFDFEGGNADGWTGLWGEYTYAVEQPGHDSDYAIHFTMKSSTAVNYDSQLFWPIALEVGVTYAYSFWVKSDCDLAVQFIGQNASYQGIYKDIFTAPADWIRCTGEFTYQESDEKDIERIGIQFGGTPGSNLWVDDFKFGKKIEEKLTSVILGNNSNFEDGNIGSWGGWGNGSTRTISEQGEGYNSDYCMVLYNPADADSYSAQAVFNLDQPLEVGKTYMYQAMVKATAVNPKFQMAVQNSSTYAGEGYQDMETVVGEWIPFEAEFTCTREDMNCVLINFGQVAGTYYVDNIKFGEKKETAGTDLLRASTRASGITYIFKTPEEKKTALLGAMETWIKGMLQHPGMERVKEWDVINEPITDNGQWRGIDGNFMSNGDEAPDTTPVEDPETGFSLNWAADHFYWGYYIGKEYAVKAFEYARKYAPADTKLYVNDYNLETSPNKLNALIDFVKFIEDNGQTVDGIGTQMHVSTSITRAQVDAMFKTMAQTGKLVRVTELDVQVGTASPSAEQLASQADVYQMIVESYKENVPEAQQSGITIWSLTDSSKEHEYWLSGDAPNLFDANYGRKHAYKGVCDGIAGRDISEDFSGDDWKNAYKEEEETPTE